MGPTVQISRGFAGGEGANLNKSFWRRWLNWRRASHSGQSRRVPSAISRPRFEILEDRVTPSVTAQFGLASESLLESAGTFTIPVLLSSISATPTTVPFTMGGSAANFTDYTGLTSSPVVIPAGQIGVNISGTLQTPNDGVKSLTFTLGTPTGATLGATTVNTMTISQPTANPTTLSIANSSAIEPGPAGTVNMDFTVTRTGDLTSQITVGYTTVAGTAQPATDFTPQTGTTTFVPGSATATISIPILHDGVISSPTLTFSVQLTGIVSDFGPPVTFADHSDFATATQPFSVAIADMNGDGKPDIVSVSYSSQAVSVLLNTTPPGATTPSFAPLQTFSAGNAPTSVALGDLNGDGRPDIIVSNFNFQTVTVLLNTTPPGATTASFTGGQTFATGGAAVRVVLGDINGDGKPDLIVGDAGKVAVLLNTTPPGATTASFAADQTFVTGSGASVAMADINGDGKPDIIVANQNDNTVSVLRNTTAPGATTPSFASQQTFVTGAVPFNVVAADLNGDGRPDLIVTNSGDNTVSVLLNTTAPGAGTLSFAGQQTFATGTDPVFVAVADLNGDGEPDLIVTNEVGNTVSVLRNMTTPGAATFSFAPQQAFATVAGGSAYSVAVADVNGDGRPDVIVDNKQGNSMSVFLNTTVLGAATITPAFPQVTTSAVESDVFAVAAGDLNGDGKPDLVVSNFAANTVSVLMNTSPPGSTTPSFASAQTFATGFARSVTLGDINGDGLPDIIVAIGNNMVAVLMNTTAPGSTTASFAPQQTFAAGTSSVSVVLADINGDGKLDLVVADGSPGAEQVLVLLNTTPTGATTPSFAPAQSFAVGNQPFSVTIGDINGDGKPDIVAPNTADGTVSVLLNTTPTGAATASFTTQQTFTTRGEPASVALGDINGDGLLDIVVANNDSTVSVLLNTTPPGATTASFATQQPFATGKYSNSDSLALGDINGDGKPDIITANEGSKNVSVLLNTTVPGSATASFTTQQTFATQTGSEAVTLVDLTDDFRPDIVVAPFNGPIAVFANTPVTIPGNTATGTILVPAGPPTVQFSVASETVDETTGTFSITVTLSGASSSSVTVPFTLGGTAVSGTDFSGVTGSPLSIAAGNTAATITGTLLSDPGASQTLIFTLGSPTNATLGTITVNTLTITEPPVTPTVQFSAASETVDESAGTFSITVALSAASSQAVSVPFTLSGTAVSGTDFSGVTGSPLSIAAGDTSGTITGTLLSDPGTSPMLVFTLGTPTNATLGGTTVNTLTITEPGVTPTAQFSAASETVDESAGTFSITVALSAASSQDVSVPFALSGTAVSGTDFSGVTASPLSIAAGDTTATITGTLLADAGANPTLIFTLGAPTNATLGGITVNTLTITEPGATPTVQFSVASETIDESTGTFSITVALSAASSRAVSVPFTLSGTAVSGTDFSGVAASPLSIAAGNLTATITGTLLADPGASPTMIFTLGTPTNANLGRTTVNTLTITEPTGTTVNLSGTVFFDFNVNGVLDSGEPGLAGRTVFLDLKNSGNLDTGDPSTVTGADGSYQFAGLTPGTYTVRELIQYDNVDVTGAGASRVVAANASVSGINIGNLLYNPAFPVYAVADLFTPPPNADATTAYVHGLYQAVLDRASDPQGLAYWVGLLQTGVTKATVDYSFVNSKEHRQNEVAYYYQNFLGEAPDSASAPWVTDLMNGEGEEAVVQGILAMPLYTTLHPTDAEFVTDLYFHLLGRQADSGGLAHWEQLLSSGSSRGAIVADFFESTSESAMLASQGFYAAFLHRAPDPKGDAHWIGQLQPQLQTFGQVAAGYFWTTSEYQTNADQSVE
jgi:FG-GAP-like repeat/SdrD B-like domain/Domain of unknown function (DUF4214)/Calx-beta domain/FG-GAP repeat